jgi:hypothetical protein
MAFCAYCGKQIADGEICSCQQQQTNQNVNGGWQGQPQGQPQMGWQGQPQQQPNPQVYYQQASQVYGQTSEQARQASAAAGQAASQYASQAGNILNETVGHVLLILKAPADAAKSFVVSANIKVSIVLVVLQAILSGLFSLCIVAKLNSLISIERSRYLNYDYFSKGGAFGYTFLMSIVFSIVFMLLAWAVAAISKGKSSYQQMLSVAGIRSTYLMPVALISIILFFIKPGYGITFFFLAGAFITCSALIESLRVVPGINENLKTYLAVIAMIIFSIIVIYFTVKVTPNTLSSYTKTQIGDIGKFDMMDVLDGLFDLYDYLH